MGVVTYRSKTNEKRRAEGVGAAPDWRVFSEKATARLKRNPCASSASGARHRHHTQCRWPSGRSSSGDDATTSWSCFTWKARLAPIPIVGYVAVAAVPTAISWSQAVPVSMAPVAIPIPGAVG